MIYYFLVCPIFNLGQTLTESYVWNINEDVQNFTYPIFSLLFCYCQAQLQVNWDENSINRQTQYQLEVKMLFNWD